MLQPSPTSVCQEYLRLLALYKDAVGKLTASGAALSDSAISYEADMFNKAWAISPGCLAWLPVPPRDATACDPARLLKAVTRSENIYL